MYCLHFIVTLLIEEVSVAFALFPSPHFMTPAFALFGLVIGAILAAVFFLVFGKKIFYWVNARRIKRGLPAIQAHRVFVIIYIVAVSSLTILITLPSLLPDPSSPVTLSSTDQAIALTFPGGWEKVTGLNADASLQASNSKSDAWALVINENKADFAVDLTGYSKLIIDGMSKRMTNFTILGGPIRITINNLPALEYLISGDTEHFKFNYLIDIVEGKTQYHQILGYALQSKFQTELSVFQSIFHSATFSQ